MNRLFSVLLVLLVIGLAGSCKSKKSESDYKMAAQAAQESGQFETAIENYKLLIEHYPDSSSAASSMFMLGFINANLTQNLPEGEKYYKLFIEKYPDHELVKDAKVELENLGKDPSEWSIFKNLEDSLATQK